MFASYWPATGSAKRHASNMNLKRGLLGCRIWYFGLRVFWVDASGCGFGLSLWLHCFCQLTSYSPACSEVISRLYVAYSPLQLLL